jgi:hypothetical protein
MLNLNFVKQKPSNRSLVKHITKKIESLLSPEIGDVQILVTEVQCYEPDCVPIETLIIILGSEYSRWTTKILKPLSEVTDDDILALEIPSTLPTPAPKEKTTSPSPPPSWVGSMMKIIDDHQQDPQYLSGLEYLQKYIAKKLESPSPSNQSDTAPPAAAAPPLPPPTMVKMKSTIPSPSPSLTSISSSQSPQASPTLPKMTPHLPSPAQPPRPPPIPMNVPSQPLLLKPKQLNDEGPKPRHQKGVRQRGCPCCDPDNLDNIVDRLLYFDAPP